MPELDSLVSSLLEQKPDLTRSDVDSMIRRKKEKIGAGYLTDEGAVFLIASDMGVQLGEPVGAEMELKDLYAGAKEITFKARMLNLAPARHLTRKDGTPLLLRHMVVYDGSVTRTVTFWDDKTNISELDGLRPGDLLRISKAYTRTDPSGEIAVNMGDSSSVEPLRDTSDIPTIDAITVDVSSVAEGQRNLAVSGTVEGQLGTIQFTNAQGQPRTALRMRLRGMDGESTSVILWGKDEADLPKSVPLDARAVLIGVSTKAGRRGPKLEIHGNEGTAVVVEGSQQLKPILIRVVSSRTDDSGDILILGSDRRKSLFTLRDSSKQTQKLAEGDMLECVPAKSFGNSITLNELSYVHAKEDDPSIPRRAALRTKVADVRAGGLYCIEAIILKKPEVREINTKAGKSVQLGEMFVEDDTLQIWVKGWDSQSAFVSGLETGQIISVAGVEARPGMEDKIELFLTPFSSIVKKV